MYLTLYDLEQIKKNCDNLSNLVTEIKHTYNPSNIEQKLFVSRADYNESLKIKNKSPQDFYYFRAFDTFIQIVFNKRTKKYQIYIEGYYDNILNKYKKIKDKSYEISEDFETCLKVYGQILIDFIQERFINELF